VGWTIVVVLLDALLIFYVTSHGFEPLTGGITVGGFSFQLQWLPLVGVLIVALAVWSDVFTRMFPRWLGPETDPMARLRLLRVVTVSLTAFVCFLYLPYLFGSYWFWIRLSQASHVIHQLEGFGNWLENLELPILTLNPVWQYAVTQILACVAFSFSAWALARPAKRPRRIR
jgi:hypothetical protein